MQEILTKCTLCSITTEGKDFGPTPNTIDRSHRFVWDKSQGVDSLKVFCRNCWKKIRCAVHRQDREGSKNNNDAS